jgi:hypothetical protein
VRELDERLGFGELIAQHQTDSRKGKNAQLPLAGLLRQSVYSRIAGYEDVNDAERLSQDTTFRLIGSEKIWERGAALTSRLRTFETQMLSEEENYGSLARINRELTGEAEAFDSPQRVVQTSFNSQALRWIGKPSRKSTGFEQPRGPNQHWRVDVSDINIVPLQNSFRDTAR